MRSQPHIHSGNESSTPHLHALEHKVDKRSRAPTHVLFQVSKMAGVMVSVATGVMTSVVEKLTILLGGEFNLASDVRRGIRFMKDELCSMNAALQRLADVDDDQIDVQTIQWRSKVRELSYDIEDCVDRFMLLHGCDKAKKNFVKSTLRKIFPLWGDRQIAKEIQDLKARVIEEKERRDRYNVDQYINDMHQRVCLDPRAPTLYEEARDLVGIHGPREEIIGWLKDEERQLKVVSIFGIGGQGKTTLAMEAYRKTQEPFDCRASVTVSRALDINKLLRDILFQINRGEYDRSERWDMEQLIPTLREYLMDKRYLIVIDDIWSVLDWEYVKSALPTNNNRSRIITTTRIKDVAQSCCAGGGHIYEAKPLSEEHSSRLFFRRIFCSLEECPHELREVANDILRKCAGLPLAIISIAGLLANKSRTVDVWTKVRNSVSCAAEKDSLVDKMKRILFFSYFDLPHYLKTCLLYLSIFPEDYTIDCRDLVRRWVAEGLIPGRSRESMELLGECYLHELINRSMVQPTKLGVDGTTVKVCRVHDLVLDFIISQSVEDNFVAILNANVFHGNFSNKIRRLCLQSNFPEASDVAKAVVNNISHLRSFYLIISDQEELGTQVSHLLNGQVLQVLSIEGASTWGDHPERIGNFSRLKYLKIGEMVISKIPEEIGNLQHLEILDVRENLRIRELPASIVQLHKLVCLFIHKEVKLPSGIGNLQALEELSSVGLHRASVECIHELGRLTKLKALEILGVARDVEGRREACISSLSKLVTRSLRSLQFTGGFGSGFMNSWIVSCGSTTAQLRKLVLNVKFDFIPSRIGSLVNLTRLNFGVRGEVGEEGIKTLASLPVLLSLTVSLHTDFSGVIHPKHVIGRQGFQHLLKFNFNCQYDGALEFEAGAMPKLQSLKLKLQARFQFKYGNGGLLVGLPYLLGLKHIAVVNNCTNAVTEEVDTLENGIRDAAKTLPNYPVCEITREDQ